MSCCNPHNRYRAAVPFAIVAGLAIVAGGLIAATIAHNPTQPLVWMVAYLVLVVGVAQLGFGIGQAFLADDAPSTGRVRIQFVFFNAGNAGVIAGTLLEWFPLVAASALFLAVALALFFYGVRNARRGWQLYAYWLLLSVIFTGALVGVMLSAT
ncbi:MAG TPA: hypothetical protein VFP95_01115 [Gammaproteobacteria bacterium]|nr:hypothetical protein [Gammaproteobacteria bacterium]